MNALIRFGIVSFVLIESVLPLAVHMYAVVIAYNLVGPWAAVATFLLPVLSELYWMSLAWRAAGPTHPFVILCLLTVALYLVDWFTLRRARKEETDPE